MKHKNRTKPNRDLCGPLLLDIISPNHELVRLNRCTVRGELGDATLALLCGGGGSLRLTLLYLISIVLNFN